MSNLKRIERASRSSKDPNPLATTMGIMGITYPLSIDKELAQKYNIPKRFMPENSFQKRDFHKLNRVLEKMEEMNWWLEEGPEMDDNTTMVCNILMKQRREE